MRNPYRDFDPFIQAELGIYIYALIDPRDRRVFYVGKGGGELDGQGNSRVFAHFNEADNPARNSTKVQTIRAIWAAGLDVEWQIVRRRLSSVGEAFHVESGIIDALALSPNGTPDNDQPGHGAALHSHIPPIDILALGAPSVNPRRACIVFVFDINQEIARRRQEGDITEEDLYEATRKSWSIGPQLRNLPSAYAVGVIRGISYSAYSVEGWAEIKHIEGGATKFAFSRRQALTEEQEQTIHALHRKNWTGVLQPSMPYRQWGRPVVLEFHGNGTFQHVLPATMPLVYNCLAG